MKRHSARSVTIFWATCSGCHKTKPINPLWLVSYRGGVLVDAKCNVCSELRLTQGAQQPASDGSLRADQVGPSL